MNAPAFTRRRFTGGLGTLVIAFSLDPNLAFAQERLPGSLQTNRKLDGWVRINPEGTATIEAEVKTVGFADEAGKKNEFYWSNPDLVPEQRPKGGHAAKTKK